MKALNYKSLVIAASLMIVSGLTSESVFAQRGGSRGGGGGGSGRSGGGGGGSISRGSSGAGMSRGGGNISRSSGNISQSRGNGSINQNRGNGNISQSRGNAGRNNPGNISRSAQVSGNRIGGRQQGFNRPGGRPGFNRPGGRPGFNRPGYGRPGYGRPGYGYGRPNYGFYGRPNYGYYNYYRPYLGFSFSVLPFGYYPFFFGADQFYYSGGLFYRQYDNQYKVVDPPIGAEIQKLPEDANEVVINGQTFYEYKGVYYTESQNADGKTVYVVAGKDGVLNTDADSANLPAIGDIVTELPEGSNEVILKGEKYYVSPDHVYYEEVVDGTTITYRVIGL